MDDLIEVSLLMDFYGQLLTQRQYEIMDMYYNNDYSLGEIAENIEISRQAVHDSLKKAKVALGDYEQKLNLVKRFLNNKQCLRNILDKISTMNTDEFKKYDREIIKSIKNEIEVLVKDL